MSFWVDFESCRGNGLTNPVVRDAFDGAIIPLGLGWIDAKDRTVGHVEGAVAMTTVAHALATLSPEDLRGRIARRLTQEAHDVVVEDSLVLWRQGDSWRI